MINMYNKLLWSINAAMFTKLWPRHTNLSNPIIWYNIFGIKIWINLIYCWNHENHHGKINSLKWKMYFSCCMTIFYNYCKLVISDNSFYGWISTLDYRKIYIALIWDELHLIQQRKLLELTLYLFILFFYQRHYNKEDFWKRRFHLIYCCLLLVVSYFHMYCIIYVFVLPFNIIIINKLKLIKKFNERVQWSFFE